MKLLVKKNILETIIEITYLFEKFSSDRVIEF